MQRTAAIIGSAIFLVIAPGTLAVYVPWYLTHWHFAPPLFPIARVLGGALIVAGLPILLDSFARFALQGLGTPAPVMPPKHLVVTGFYRYVRNPMYVAVTALIAGQGLLFGKDGFGESLPEDVWSEAVRIVRECDLLLVVGTSSVVYPAAGLASIARGARVIEVNLEETPLSGSAHLSIRGKSGEILPALVNQ